MSVQNGQSVQSDILDAVVTTLGGNAGGAWRCRFSDFAVAELPAFNVIPDDEAEEYQDTDGVERFFRFKIRHMAASVDGADKVADALYAKGYKLLFADRTLGGAVRIIKEVATKWEMEKAEYETIARVVTYEVEYSTTVKDPRVPGY